MESIIPLFIRLTEPSHQIQNSEERLKARLFSAVLLIMGLFTWISSVIFFLVSVDKQEGLLGVAIIVLAAYVGSRSRHYQWVANVIVWILAVFPLVMFRAFGDFSLRGVFDVLIWLPMPVLLSSLVLTPRRTALLT